MEYTRYINSTTRDNINLVMVGECEEFGKECKEKSEGREKIMYICLAIVIGITIWGVTIEICDYLTKREELKSRRERN